VKRKKLVWKKFPAKVDPFEEVFPQVTVVKQEQIRLDFTLENQNF